jgi:hypothetical protein
LNEQIEAQRRRIAELEDDKAWLESEIRQYKAIVAPPAAATTDIYESREVVPPVRFDKPHYPGWARLMAQAIDNAETIAELEALPADHREHIDTFEAESPGAGKGIEQRISKRLLHLR